MGNKSAIQWTDATWNVARGCTKVDADCLYCYMYRDSFDSTRYNPLQIVRTKTVFNLPLKLKEPSKIFTSSLTDFFHPEIDSYRNECWDIIRKCPQHIFQILTKRPERILSNLPEFWNEIKDRVWLGTSCGSQQSEMRWLMLHTIREIAPTIFLSLEPLHGEIKLPSKHFFNWIIIGGESGNDNGKYRYRECKIEWFEKIIQNCKENNTAIFVKQLGTFLSKELHLSDRHGGNIDEFPEHLRIREFPKY